jgi:hypothetical protein
MYLFDSSFLILIPALIISAIAQFKIKSTYNKYEKIYSQKGITGFEVANAILRENNLNDVKVVETKGKLSDHYDPRSNIIRLSRDVYSGSSIASCSIAAHEVGHAIQHANNYFPITVRDALVPVASFGSKSVWIFVMLGIFLSMPSLVQIGVFLFAGIVLFQIVTLPVEFNASRRALSNLEGFNMLTSEEMKGAKKMLRAAAFTYIAATLVAISQLIRLLALSNRRR